MTHYETREVLAGAYAGRARSSIVRRLTHTVIVQSGNGADTVGEVVLCRRVRVEHMADRHANPLGLDIAPTCGECLRRDPRFK